MFFVDLFYVTELKSLPAEKHRQHMCISISPPTTKTPTFRRKIETRHMTIQIVFAIKQTANSNNGTNLHIIL